MINVYGPTEATISSINHVIPPGAAPRPELQVPIGRVHRGRAAYVLDPNFELAPIGALGELYLGGAGVARGYLAPARPHRRALRPRSVRAARARRDHVPDRRSGPLPRRRRARVPRPRRRHGQAPRLPHRARRGRGRARRPTRASPAPSPWSARTRKSWSPTRSRSPAPRRPAPEALRAFVRAKLPPYMVPAAVVLVERSRACPTARSMRRRWRGSRPPPSASPAPAGRPPHADGGADRRQLARAARRRRDRPRRRLLRPRRPLAARRPPSSRAPARPLFDARAPARARCSSGPTARRPRARRRGRAARARRPAGRAGAPARRPREPARELPAVVTRRSGCGSSISSIRRPPATISAAASALARARSTRLALREQCFVALIAPPRGAAHHVPRPSTAAPVPA